MRGLIDLLILNLAGLFLFLCFLWLFDLLALCIANSSNLPLAVLVVGMLVRFDLPLAAVVVGMLLFLFGQHLIFNNLLILLAFFLLGDLNIDLKLMVDYRFDR
jgi:hypothetical protein